MISIFFPFVLQLQILQQSEYRISSFIKWIFRNFLKRRLEDKKKLVFSAKAKVVLIGSIGINVLSILVLTFIFGIVGLLIGLILSTQSYVFLTLSTLILKPFEQILRVWIKRKTVKKLNSSKKLKVIGITGSYGKTSVKEFLYAILKTRYAVLKTPESYNTVLGISKVIDLELDESYEYFICEMAAYKRGEIKELCEMLHPRHGILTGINEQHLEMFGSIQNTIKAKFELIDSIPKNGFAVINTGNKNIEANYKIYDKNFVFYSLGNSDFSAKKIKITKDGTNFDLVLNKKIYSAKTKLLGKSQIENIVAASTLAFKLEMTPSKIVDAIKNIRPVPHRLELKMINNFSVIDNSYNSNVTGFKEALNLLESFENNSKVIVTPGIVDLGTETLKIHKDLGLICNDVCDFVILVGKSDRTRGLEEGISSKKKIIFINSIKDVWRKLKEMNLKDPIILLENDLPDNY